MILGVKSPSLRVRAPRGRVMLEIRVFGHRVPRGPDNSVFVWVDEEDQLHIRVLKPDRCYRYKQTIEAEGYIEVIQS